MRSTLPYPQFNLDSAQQTQSSTSWTFDVFIILIILIILRLCINKVAPRRNQNDNKHLLSQLAASDSCRACSWYLFERSFLEIAQGHLAPENPRPSNFGIIASQFRPGKAYI
ncbi:hypothetical protein DL98DRAFT_584565 [Cadophora sp. DSE1049]|nr:hypothetical protein DL98DRAFT_584565 [Cadophora sp. DSE1049]